MKTRVNRWWVMAGVGAAVGCTDATSTGSVSGQDVTSPGPVDPGTLTQDEKAFRTKFAAVLAESGTMTPEKLASTYASPASNAPLGYDPLAAAHLDEITTNFALTEADRQKLATNGFVVLARQEPTPTMVF
ncbi:MAG: hypothetical protein IV100_17430, partial [Myxococcales bacterium]|nr:hypothetical protein [Myxococcales bacterium]